MTDLEVVQQFGDRIQAMEDRITPKNRAQRRALAKQERAMNKNRAKLGIEASTIKQEVMERFYQKLKQEAEKIQREEQLKAMEGIVDVTDEGNESLSD